MPCKIVMIKGVCVKKIIFFFALLVLPCNLETKCKNGATCTNDNLGGYLCLCPSGYTGTNCEIGRYFLKA